MKFEGKIPPQAIDIEEVVLGALMIEKDALIAVIDILKPESFYKEAHVNIFESIIKLFNNSEPIDLKTVGNQLRKDGKLETVGGSFYIASLTNKVNSSANIEHHARILNERMIKRELIKVCADGQGKGYDDTEDGFDLLGEIEQSLLDISQGNIGKQFTELRSVIKQNLNELEERRKSKSGITGISSGFKLLDNVTAGWQKQNLIIIAARPGMGKSAFVLSSARNAALELNIPVAIFSLEMSKGELGDRLLSSESELEGEKIKRGTLADYEFEQLIHKTAKLTEAPIFIDDTSSLSVIEFRAKARRLKIKHNIQLIIVDYIQLMTGEKNGGREQEIASISRALKNTAKDLDVPVVALSQLSRAVETRGGDKRPTLSDLRESGAIEQDADMVMFLYRPEYYGITEDESGNSTLGIADAIIAKHRNGSLETVPLKFIGKYTKFTDLDYSHFDKTGLPPEKFPSGGNLNFYEKDEESPF